MGIKGGFLCLAAKATTLFSKRTKSIVWGMQTRAVQGMLDFDYVCSREEPSVAAMVYPFTYALSYCHCCGSQWGISSNEIK